ncbi:hypothetical protein ACGFS9_04175 [Streptomyces sp. NPDC048566]|uniref:hypothetical protein n=1 Tax=Streptomyces sp. NPDC048566 TaxID=3365569 RepID=UPI00372363DF
MTDAAAPAVAGVLTASVPPAVPRPAEVGELVRLRADFMVRGSLGPAGYVWVARRSRGTATT